MAQVYQTSVALPSGFPARAGWGCHLMLRVYVIYLSIYLSIESNLI